VGLLLEPGREPGLRVLLRVLLDALGRERGGQQPADAVRDALRGEALDEDAADAGGEAVEVTAGPQAGGGPPEGVGLDRGEAEVVVPDRDQAGAVGVQPAQLVVRHGRQPGDAIGRID
jgi:hypothetical protein